jgi:riboflavin kinase/FMN adenylyltransferase
LTQRPTRPEKNERAGAGALPVTLEHSLGAGRGPAPSPVACTIGVFDGVHRGHQRLLAATVAAARQIGGLAVAVTFEPHPRAVLDPANVPPELTTLDEKRERLTAAGIDRVVVVNFTREVSQWSAEQFCERLLDRFDLRRLVVGPGFALGRARRGDIDFLRRFGAGHGFTVETVGAVSEEGDPISSTRIRSALVSGDVEEAARLLGHPYFLDGTVERGNRVGWRLGFPTANLGVEPGKCLPELGIYTTWIHAREAWRPAASSIGYRPTFGGDRLTVEAHLLDFDADLYGERVRLAFVHRLREERWYPEEAALIAQMRLDVAETRRRLETAAAPAEL